MMRGQNGWRLREEIDGIVRWVDPIGREMEVQVEGGPVSLDVRPDCVISLRGERIKLRLIQPRDRVRVKYTEHCSARIADTIEVQPGGPAR